MTTYVKARCHCGRNVFNISFATQSLPRHNDFCHCDACRRCTGQLAANYISFDGEPLSTDSNSKPADLTHLTPFRASNVATRYFCSTCSAQILWKSDHWSVAAGALEVTEGITEGGLHIWVSDTVDGGIADHLRVIDGVELPRYAKLDDTECLPLSWRKDEKDRPERKAGEDELHLQGHCYCQAIKFAVTRPCMESVLACSPYPDLLYPHNATAAEKLQNLDDEKWWLRQGAEGKPTRYLAGHCACTSCRLTSGFEVSSWAFVPRANIIPQDCSQVDLRDESRRPKGLKQYISSEGVRREFCEKCGASVFYWTEVVPDILNVAVGVLHAKGTQGGARAEGWLHWQSRVGFSGDAVSLGIMNGLLEGLRASQAL